MKISLNVFPYNLHSLTSSGTALTLRQLVTVTSKAHSQQVHFTYFVYSCYEFQDVKKTANVAPLVIREISVSTGHTAFQTRVWSSMWLDTVSLPFHLYSHEVIQPSWQNSKEYYVFSLYEYEKCLRADPICLTYEICERWKVAQCLEFRRSCFAEISVTALAKLIGS